MDALRRVGGALLLGGRTILFPPGTLSAAESFYNAWDICVRILFAAYYIPVVLVCLGGLLDVLLHLSFTVVIPAVHDEAPDLEELSAWKALQYWASLLKLLLPYVTSIVGVLAMGHKLLRSVGEAMVDSYSVFNGMNYSLTLGMFTFALESYRRIVILVTVSVALCAAFGLVFLTDIFLIWTSRDQDVRRGTWAIIVLQFLGVSYSVVHHAWNHHDTSSQDSLGKLRAFVISWWRDNIGRIRHSAMNMLIVMTAVVLAVRGPIRCLAFFIETLIYLNFPNIVGFTCLSATLSAIRITHGWRWLARHPSYARVVVLLTAPYGVCWGYTVLYFEGSLGIVLLACFALVTLTARSVDMCRQYEVGPSGSTQWAASNKKANRAAPLPTYLAAELEDAYQRGTKRPALVSLEYRYLMDSMTLECRTDGQTSQLKRTQRSDPAPPMPPVLIALQLLPRLLLFESRNAFAGSRFNRLRIVLKAVLLLTVTVITFVVGGTIVQETVLPLQPIAVAAERTTDRSRATEVLSLHHIVLDLHIRYTNHALTSSSSSHTRDDLDGEEDELGALCLRRHGNVSLFELALFSAVPYVDSKESLGSFVDGVNVATDSDWKVVYPLADDLGPRRRPREPWHSLVELRSAAKNMTLISIRGTDFTSSFDMLQDVSIYLEAFLYQLMTHVVPVSSLVPTSLVTDAIELTAAVEAYTVPWSPKRLDDAEVRTRHFHDVVIRHITSRTREAGDMALLGHSLGGALAHIAGARLGIKSFGFHSPGIVLPRKKLGVSLSMLNRVATTVIASHDIVPWIGGQAGELLHLECNDNFRERCHAVESTIEAMWSGCKSVRDAFPKIVKVWIS